MPNAPAPVTIMTGASGGLGQIALPMFVEAGHRVVAVALDWPPTPATTPPTLAITGDLTDPAVTESVIAETLERYGRIDCLVHMVGTWKPGSPLEETSDELWDNMMAVNLRAAFYAIRAVIRPMRDTGGGRIVIVGSTAAIQPVVTWAAFSAAMGGLNALVQVAAAELREDRITVNIVHPSTIDTAAVHAHYGDLEAIRFVDPRGMVSLMLWLCSSAAGDVSGTAIAMPGRQTHPTYHWPGITD